MIAAERKMMEMLTLTHEFTAELKVLAVKCAKAAKPLGLLAEPFGLIDQTLPSCIKVLAADKLRYQVPPGK